MYEELKPWLVEIRRDFHSYPELGMQEFRTSRKIAEYLREMDIEVIEGVANTGVVGIIRGEQEGKTVGIRADIDALPMEDTKEVSYKSRVAGVAHACGHDAHTAMLLGAAKVLSTMKKDLKGNVKLFFQPAEESVGGAKFMVEHGVMKNPQVNAVFGLHVDPELNTGTIGIRYGKMNAASDSFKIVIHGASSHGAYPHTGVDTVIVAAQILTALQTVISRNVDPRDSAVLTVGKIHGGTATNIICDTLSIGGMIRTLSEETRRLVLERAKTIVEKTAEAFGATAEFIRYEGYAALINVDEYVDLVKASGEKLLGSKNVSLKQYVSLGVEDFSYFLEEAPGAFFTLGCKGNTKGDKYSLHNSDFDIDEDCLLVGVGMHVENVLNVLKY